MLFKELADDATSRIKAYTALPNLTVSNFVLAISEGLNEMQKQTRVMEKTITIDAADLDSNGAIALDKSITTPRRGTYRVGTGVSAPCPVVLKGRDEMAEIRMGKYEGSGRIFMCLEQNQLFFYPFQGLAGTFTLSCIAQMPLYVASAATDATSFWYGWDAANLNTKYGTTHIPQEFNGALTGLTAYVAAQLLTFIPGWRRRFEVEYNEFLQKFEGEMENIKENLPDYELNYDARPNWGGAY